MTLGINPRRVDAVLLDVWYEVERGTMFFDAYEFCEPGTRPMVDYAGNCDGASFVERGTGSVIHCPAHEIHAVRMSRRDEAPGDGHPGPS